MPQQQSELPALPQQADEPQPASPPLAHCSAVPQTQLPDALPALQPAASPLPDPQAGATQSPALPSQYLDPAAVAAQFYAAHL